MFKHILIPTDGSRLAAKGIKVGVKLAKSLGARVTGLYVAAPYMPPMYGEAGVAGVPCRLDSVSEVQPWRGILRVARTRRFRCSSRADQDVKRSATGKETGRA